MVVEFTATYAISDYHNWRAWIPIPPRRGVLNTTFCDKVCQWLVTGQWFSPGTPVSSTNKTYHHDVTAILFKSGAKHHNPNPDTITGSMRF